MSTISLSHVTNYAIQVCDKILHSSQALERSCYVIQEIFRLIHGNNLPTSLCNIDKDLTKATTLLTSFDLAICIDHFFIKKTYKKSSAADNIFYAGYAVITTLDALAVFEKAKLINLGKFASKFTKNHPLIYLSIYWIAYGASIKGSIDILRNPLTPERKKLKEWLELIYSIGFIAIEVLNLTPLANYTRPFAAFKCAIYTVSICSAITD